MAGYNDTGSNVWVLPAMYASLAVAVVGGLTPRGFLPFLSFLRRQESSFSLFVPICG